MLGIDKNGEFYITDREAFDRWCNPPQPKHMNKLDYYNEYVQQAIQKFPEEDPISVYYQCKKYYWWNCATLKEFEEGMKEKLEIITNIRELSEIEQKETQAIA